MKILITGSTGFIGSNFIRAAIAGGHKIAALVSPGKPVPAQFGGLENITLTKGTLAEAPWDEIAAFRPDICVHCAWIATPGVYLESPENFRLVGDSLRFLAEARQCGVSHVVSLGTCVEYRITGGPLSETRTPVASASAYARCKNELRIALENAARSEGFANCWARVFYPYGPGEHPSRLCSSIIRQISLGEKIILKTPHSAKDYIFIDDLAAALLRVVESKFSGVINLGTGDPVTVLEIAQTIARQLGREELIDFASGSAPDPLDHVVADAGLLRGLGWKPAVGMGEGIGRLIPALNP